MSAPAIAAAQAHLRGDVRLAALLDALPAPRPNARRDPFHALIVAILNQQISRQVAGVIEARLAKLVGTPFAPRQLRGAAAPRLRATGMSASKVACAKACAAAACADELSASSCRRLRDEEITARLVAIKGVGAWTAQMVLFAGLGRADVMPDGDGGIQRAAALLFNSRSLVTARRRLLREARKWSPYRSVAAWYLWRSLD